MSESDPHTAGEPDSDHTQMTVPDEELPEDLQPGGDNPLAGPADDQGADRQDLGDPHIEGLERDSDDNLSLPESDAEDQDGES